MQSLFIDKKELAKLFRCSPRTAQAALAKKGVLPIKLGGETSALLWHREDVMNAVDILRAEARVTSSDYVQPARGDKRLLGKTLNQIHNMVTQ